MTDQKTPEQLIADQMQAKANAQLQSEIDYLSNIFIRIIDGRTLNVSINALIQTIQAYGTAMPTANREVLINSIIQLGTVLMNIPEPEQKQQKLALVEAGKEEKVH